MKRILTSLLRAILPHHTFRQLQGLYRSLKWRGQLPLLVVIVGNACSLRCKNCSNFCPHAPKENKRYRVDEIIADLKNILENITEIRSLQIQGGEPFLYSDLGSLLDFCASQPKIKQVMVATNGTLMPSDDLLQKIKARRIQIRISNYPVSSDKGQSLYQKCRDLGIGCSIYNFAYGKQEWAVLGGIDTPRENCDPVVKRRYRSCAFRSCLTLENGELNRCSRLYMAHRLQGFARNADDQVDVRDKKGLKKRLREYLCSPRFPEGCRYCYGNDETQSKRCIPGEQIDDESKASTP